VTFSDKHNEANLEGNRDGENNNFSANHGVEGPTSLQEIESLRLRQIKNLLTTLMMSQGVPMLLSGDECRRTQLGNNNAYCQDNEISWFDWRLVEKHQSLVRFVQGLISFRRSQPTVRRTEFPSGVPSREGELPDVSWFLPTGSKVDWGRNEHSLSCLFAAPQGLKEPSAVLRHVLIFVHAGTLACDFVLPPTVRSLEWRLFVDTAAESPHDIYPRLDGPAFPNSGSTRLIPHSLACYVAPPTLKRSRGR
jgi:glycogen operon protein